MLNKNLNLHTIMNTHPSGSHRATTDIRRRPCLLIFSLIFIILAVVACIIYFGFIKISPPHFQVESVTISFQDNSVAKWNIGFSVANLNVVTLRYREVGVSVGGRQPQNSTTATVVMPMYKHGLHGRSSLSATVDVVLPSPRPRLSIDGVDFDVRFLTKYASLGRKAAAVAVACGDKDVGFSTSNGEVVMVGGPVRCEVVPRKL